MVATGKGGRVRGERVRDTGGRGRGQRRDRPGAGAERAVAVNQRHERVDYLTPRFQPATAQKTNRKSQKNAANAEGRTHGGKDPSDAILPSCEPGQSRQASTRSPVHSSGDSSQLRDSRRRRGQRPPLVESARTSPTPLRDASLPQMIRHTRALWILERAGAGADQVALTELVVFN